MATDQGPSGQPPAGPGLIVAIGGKPKPPGAGAPSGNNSSNDDCVPLSSLNMPDESEQMQAPEVGDRVQYTVEGTVSRIDGNEAYVKRETINSQPVDDDKDGPEAQTPPDVESGANADQAGSDQGYSDLEDQARNTTLQ